MKYFHRKLRNKSSWSPFKGFETSIDENGYFMVPETKEGEVIDATIERLFIKEEDGHKYGDKDGRYIYKEGEEGFIAPKPKPADVNSPIEQTKISQENTKLKAEIKSLKELLAQAEQALKGKGTTKPEDAGGKGTTKPEDAGGKGTTKPEDAGDKSTIKPGK